MLSEPAQVVVGTLLYTIKFERRDDALVDLRARALIEEPLRELTVEEEYDAIAEALASNANLSRVIHVSDWIKTAPDEEEFRDFLRRLRDRLDTMRPWPTPPHRKLDRSRWMTDFASARVVGRLRMRYVTAQENVNYVFSSIHNGDTKRRVLILKLRSGDEVALVTPWWPNSDDVAVLSRDPHRPPEEVRAALVDGTRFIPEQFEPVPSNDPYRPGAGPQ